MVNIPHSFLLFDDLKDLLSLGGFLSNRGFGNGSLGDRSLNGFSLLGTTTASRLGLLLSKGFQHVLVVVNEFDDGHSRVVTVTDAGLQDAGITTRAVGNLLRNLAEKFINSLFAVEIAEDNTAVVCGLLLSD